MEFKKCLRCGAFFMNENSVCPNCETKDRADIFQLNKFINQEASYNSIHELSTQTGISTNNINRFIKDNSLPELDLE